MALKAKITEEEFGELAEVLQEHYTKQGDEYVLDTDDKGYKDRISEFRNNNIALQQELESLKADLGKFKGIDPAKYQDTINKLQELEDKKLIDAGQIDELLAQRTERMRQDYEGRTQALETDRERFKALAQKRQELLQKTLVNSAVAEAVSSVGVPAKGALPDIQARATSLWHVDEDGNVVAMEGDTVKYGADGKNPLSMAEWAESLKQTAPHLFEGSSGGGAGGGGGKQNGGGSTVVSRADLSNNLEDVAAGKVAVVD